jgi:hypothetical protein
MVAHQPRSASQLPPAWKIEGGGLNSSSPWRISRPATSASIAAATGAAPRRSIVSTASAKWALATRWARPKVPPTPLCSSTSTSTTKRRIVPSQNHGSPSSTRLAASAIAWTMRTTMSRGTARSARPSASRVPTASAKTSLDASATNGEPANAVITTVIDHPHHQPPRRATPQETANAGTRTASDSLAYAQACAAQKRIARSKVSSSGRSRSATRARIRSIGRSPRRARPAPPRRTRDPPAGCTPSR